MWFEDVYFQGHLTTLCISHNCRFNFSSLYGAFRLQGQYCSPHEWKGRTFETALQSEYLYCRYAVSGIIIISVSYAAASSIFTDATLSDVSLDQLLRDIDTSTVAGTYVSASSVSPPANSQAASSQPHSFSSPDVSPTVGARPAAIVSYSPAEYRRLRQQNTECNFLLWWCLHHLKSLPSPPPSAGGELDLALRRLLRQTAIAPTQLDENSSFEDIVNKFYDMHVQTVTQFPWNNFLSVSYFYFACV